MSGVLNGYIHELIFLISEMAPYLLIGFFFAGVLRVFFPQRFIRRYMGEGNFRSVLNASLLGIPMPLCSCGVLPAGIGFYKNGASRGSTLSFLISTPQTGVDSILATYSLLGLPLAIIRPFVALVTGVSGGVLTNRVVRKSEPSGLPEPETEQEPPASLRELFRYGFVELLQDISKWLIIGILVAALLSVIIPDDFFIRNFSNEYLSMGMMLLASVPLYICATGSIPIAAVLLMKGLSPGAALVLLMAGPATNVATMAVIGNSMGRKSFRLYLTSIIGGALLFGILINELIPREWITGFLPAGLQEQVHPHTIGVVKWISTAILVGLIVNGYIQKKYKKSREGKLMGLKIKSMSSNMMSFRVEGMTCSHCKANVERGLSGLSGVSSVVADPDSNMVRITADHLEDGIVKNTVEGLGYAFKGRIDNG